MHERATAQPRSNLLRATRHSICNHYILITVHKPLCNRLTGFFESVFSYVFGDGNPNADIEQQRLQLLASVIRSAGGAVTAEQLAPYLDDLPFFPGDVRTNGVINGQYFFVVCRIVFAMFNAAWVHEFMLFTCRHQRMSCATTTAVC
jgi:hypothetical protein